MPPGQRSKGMMRWTLMTTRVLIPFLRRELIEIACSVLYGVSDPEALRKMLLSLPGAEAHCVSEEPDPGTKRT